VNPVITSVLVVAAYLIGAIPFGYLTAKGLKGVDIRTLGSGNIGATNVGRVLGFRFFCLVFLLDLAKGLLPTLAFPLLAARLTGRPAPPDLKVLVALATILGHNFPVYLKFKGGKGVATSLGAMFALDAVASTASAFGFTVFLTMTRFVSVSSVGGGLVFFLVHFMRVADPWSPRERAMSVLTVALLVLLIGRHRKNFARIGAGTEPKVSLGKPRKKPPAGRVAVSWLVALAVAVSALLGGSALWQRATRREVLAVGRATVTEVARAATGHQRAERVAFADGGRLLAVTCPRYNRLVVYRVTPGDGLEPLRDVGLDGKPVAVCPAADRLYVLLRPPGDSRHVEPGWWQAYDLTGARLGDRVPVGYYPDDMALSPDGRLAYVLTSGRAEGDAKKPAPALDVFETAGRPVAGGRVTFDGPHDDPARLTLSASGLAAVVTLLGPDESAAVDLSAPESPRLIGRAPLTADQPYPSVTEADRILMPAASGSEGVVVRVPAVGDCVATTLPKGSGLEFFTPSGRKSLGRLTLRGGAFGLATMRPTALAFAPERGLIAVASRSGGVHLVALRPTVPEVAARTTR